MLMKSRILRAMIAAEMKAETETKHFGWQQVWKAAQMVARDAIAQRWLDYRGEVTLAILEGRTLSEEVLSPSATLRNAHLGKMTAAALLCVEPDEIVDIQISAAGDWTVTYLPKPMPPKPVLLIIRNDNDRYPESMADAHWSLPAMGDGDVWAIEWEREGERATGTLTTRTIKDPDGDDEDIANWNLCECPFEGNMIGRWPRRGRLESDKPLEVIED